MVMLSPFATQRMPEFWPQPEAFDPSRFTPEASAGRPNYAWFPFGGGPRLCIGKPFALMEAPLILSMLMQRFRLSLVPGQDIHPQPVASLRPKPAIWMQFKPL
jgi:cytochrome P450